jgi:ABC-type transport system involved in multi-copper enzyme maturation permease subunit
MRGLLWKDYRLNRGLLLLGVVALAGVYLVGLVVEVSHTWPEMPSANTLADAIYSFGHMALNILPLLAALLGGNAIACERADRSAHFLAYLPPTKTQILASKLLVAAGALAALWGANGVLIWAVAPLLGPEPTNFMHMLGTPSGALASCVLTFGVGWLASACLEKPTFPVLLALLFPFALGYGLFLFASLTGISRFDVLEWAGTVGLAIGIAAFLAGTWCYCRRIEP